MVFHFMPCQGMIHLTVNREIYNTPHDAVMRKRITISITRCTCERCGHVWDVPDGQKIQGSCPSRTCRSPLWDRPITRQRVSDSVKAVRSRDWEARRARGWKHPSAKS